MSEQLAFALPLRAAMGRDAFFVSPANALALAEIDRWRDWPSGKLVLYGPKGAGKSHLAAVWATEAGAQILTIADIAAARPAPGARLVVEGADGAAGNESAERALLHLHNRVLELDGRLLLTGRNAPSRWPVTLPDLASRLAATPAARLASPDDALLAALLAKLFADRQIAITPDFIRWCVPRMERSFAAAQNLVAALDARALATRRPIGPKLAAELLDAAAADGHDT